MKIHNKPIQGIHTQQTIPQHISKTHNGYTIRYTQNGTTYYYGEYQTLEEATNIEYKLRQHKYPTRLSENNTHMRAKTYREWLRGKL